MIRVPNTAHCNGGPSPMTPSNLDPIHELPGVQNSSYSLHDKTRLQSSPSCELLVFCADCLHYMHVCGIKGINIDICKVNPRH